MTALVLAVVFFVVGLAFVVWPREVVVFHATESEIGQPGRVTGVVSKSGARIYGAVAMVVGAGMAALALYRPRR